NSIEQTKSVESRLTSLKETEIKQSKVIQPTQVNVVTSQEDNIYNLIGKYLYNEKIRQNGYKFHKQAKSMEAQESFKITVSGGEDAQREAKLIEEYFNWRKEVRKGVYKRAERIYVYTYIYECINDIGIKNAKDGLDKLINILENYGNEFEGLQEQLSKWIIDYVIYYNCIPEKRFYTVLKDINMNLPSLHDWNTVALLMGQQVSEPLVYLNRISSYDIYKSHYYFRSMETILNKVLRLVMCQMEKLLLVNKAPRLYEIVAGDKVTEKEWIPFENALFYNKAKHLLLNRKTEYIIGKHIRYSMRRGFWQTTMPDLTELENNEYIGNLLKCVEYHVCKKNGNYICDLKNINIPKYLEQAIENTVRECM
ncbi:MAG: TerB N-terminal domain-containing protein, partial [Clostridium sp.]|nr:TerB N-terminal domain-containing protein [Clostridium sp.]